MQLHLLVFFLLIFELFPFMKRERKRAVDGKDGERREREEVKEGEETKIEGE